ncbi:heavy metal sensor kinase [Desulfocicer vacuolatum DSM 3385]|uniref:histidine kinase n=1 Tax=Desulfocicer vacuolatum DSM 3385 TaxID=1121400 RepID=A0A1W2C426_9BACT|nr:ATP-binding protein [Desulfocicer vacuolatum]SMC79856.1 heavy metal sensor kinase [Desulfocicer vacuolatum DSM 3385]
MRFPRLFHTLAFRLTLWYAGIFVVSSCVSFMLFYLLVSRTIVNHMDGELEGIAARFSTVLSVQGLPGIKRLAALEARAAGEKKVFFRLLYPDGEVFASSYMAYWERIPISQKTLGELLNRKKNMYDTVTVGDGAYSVRVLYHLVGSGVVLQTGLAMEAYSGFFNAFGRVFVAAMALVVLLAVVPGWFMARKALGGVAAVTRTAAVISGDSLSRRVPVTGHQDELDQLATTFNGMLDRIETLVTSIREMGDNIAHDLKGPVTRIRGLAEVTLVNGKGIDEYQAMAGSTIEEADRLLSMINTMLVISRTDSGQGEFSMESLDLSQLVEEACQLFYPLAEDGNVVLKNMVQGPFRVQVDRGMMQRCLSNIMDNAIKYTNAGGSVAVTAAPGVDGMVALSVEDSGVGIETENMDRVFERFFRADASRSCRGTGLGLSLARSLARGHGGDVTVKSVPGRGSVFTIYLPLHEENITKW